MNIDNLAKSFKYSSLLVNRDLKLFKQNFDKHKPNIELYSIWDFNSITTDHYLIKDFNSVPKQSIYWIGTYIFLGNKNKNELMFLDFHYSINGKISAAASEIKSIQIRDFFSCKKRNLIKPFNLAIEQEDVIIKYINSFFKYFEDSPYYEIG